MPLTIGEIIDSRYRVVARIGHGGMAEVYEANDVINKTKVAIKVIREDVMNNETNVRRFESEITISTCLNHPNIVKVYNYGSIGARPYIAYEYVKGQTLKETLDFRSPLPLNEVIDYMLQLTNALSYAHKHGVIHRDIKPDNIFLCPDGTVKIGDFGIAIAEGLENHLTGPQEIIGSVHYLAPEISKGGKASRVSDIYALGVTFFELLTGHPPYEKDSQVNIAVAHIREKFPSTKKFGINVPKDVEKIIFKATKKKPIERYQSMKEFHDDLENIKNNPNNFQEKKGLLSRLFGFK